MQTNLPDNVIQDPQTIDKIITHRRFDYLVDKSRKIKQANHLLKALLPPPLTEHCQITNISADKLSITTSNGAYATRLRAMSKEVLNGLHYYDAFSTISHVDCRVRPQTTAQPRKKIIGAANPLTQSTRNLLKCTSDHVKNPQLKAALLKLAKNW